MSVELVNKPTEELLEAVNHLLPQLSRSAPPLSADDLEKMLAQPAVYFFFYRDDETGKILGTLTLATFVIPTGLRAWVEDVVVSEDARGKGAGQQLVEAALAHAKTIGAKSVDLTSRPSREAANRLYQRCGFVARETNIYRFNEQ